MIGYSVRWLMADGSNDEAVGKEEEEEEEESTHADRVARKRPSISSQSFQTFPFQKRNNREFILKRGEEGDGREAA